MRVFTLLVALLLFACEGPVDPEPAEAPVDPWKVSGTGDYVVDRPAHVDRIHITASYEGNSENFIVWCGKREELLVNVILGTGWETTSYDGVVLIKGDCNPIEIKAVGVTWTLEEAVSGSVGARLRR